MRGLRSRQDLITTCQPQNSWALSTGYLLPMHYTQRYWGCFSFLPRRKCVAMQGQQTEKVSVVFLWHVPYIIPALASVTPPSLLRNRTVSCGVQGVFFSTWPNEAFCSLETRISQECHSSLMISFYPIFVSSFTLPPPLSFFSRVSSSHLFTHCFFSSLISSVQLFPMIFY